MSRPPNKPLPVTARLNFLLGASDMDLSNFELARLAEVAELRSDLHAILDKLIDEMAQAAVAGWFRQTTSEKLKRAIEAQENPEARIAEVVAWAKERIKNGQRDDAELIPRTALAPGAAHLAARLRYAERNMAEGKCSICPKPLARNSVRYCDRHLAIQLPKRRPRAPRATNLARLAGCTVTEFSSQRTTKRRHRSKLSRKQTRNARKRPKRTGSNDGLMREYPGEETESGTYLPWVQPKVGFSDL